MKSGERHVFECRRTGCRFTTEIRRTAETFGDDNWVVEIEGQHNHNAGENFKPAPLREHLIIIAKQEAAKDNKGKALVDRLSERFQVQIKPHVVRYMERNVLDKPYLSLWAMMIPMLERLNENGFHTTWIPEDDSENSLRYCYVETNFAQNFLESNAFVKVAFMDGCHTQTVAKHNALYLHVNGYRR